MSWHGSVTCSYCYERGHTRRKCPNMKKKHDEYENATEEERKELPYSYRYAHNEYQVQRKTLDESSKQCTFCGKSGHRVLTCPDRLERVDQLRRINKVYKPLLRKVLQETGFGEGCLIQSQEWVTVDNERQQRNVPYMVKSLSRGALDFCNLHDGFGTLTATSMISFHDREFYLPREFRYEIIQAVCSVEGYEWAKERWSVEARNHPFQRMVRSVNKPTEMEIISPSSNGFDLEQALYPLEKKRDINKMFRQEKKRSDRGRFYTLQDTQYFVSKMFQGLQEHKGWEL